MPLHNILLAMVVVVDYRRRYPRHDARRIPFCEWMDHDGDGEWRMRMVDWSATARAAVVDEWMLRTCWARQDVELCGVVVNNSAVVYCTRQHCYYVFDCRWKEIDSAEQCKVFMYSIVVCSRRLGNVFVIAQYRKLEFGNRTFARLTHHVTHMLKNKSGGCMHM